MWNVLQRWPTRIALGVVAVGMAVASACSDGSKDAVAPNPTAEPDNRDPGLLPFPAEGPYGRATTRSRVKVVEDSEVVSIVDDAPSYVVTLRITGDVEAVIDAYAEQLGCGPGNEFENDPTQPCRRSPLHFELVGLAGGDFYTLDAHKDGASWVAEFSYADG
jgi:hypothetical protein